MALRVLEYIIRDDEKVLARCNNYTVEDTWLALCGSDDASVIATSTYAHLIPTIKGDIVLTGVIARQTFKNV